MEIHKKAVSQASPPDASTLAQLVITSAQREDFNVVATLFAALHEYNASLNEKFTLATNWREILSKQFSQAFDDNCSLWALAWMKQQPIGLLILQKQAASLLFPQSNQAELVALYVEPAYRRAGVAYQLMDYANQWSISQGISSLQLYVTIQNTQARAFYRRCGWHPVQEIWHQEVIQPAACLLPPE